MDRTRSSTISSFDLPRADSSGLSEWTSRIKAIQAQVDADEEAEQRRLEEEIAASRAKRMSRRQSQGISLPRGSVDLSRNSHLNGLRSPVSPDFASTAFGGPKSPSDVHTSSSFSTPLVPQTTFIQEVEELRPPRSESSIRPSSSMPKTGAEPMSLAAFIGGRATGPRLNKHAPQQDAHDPTQFDQRSYSSIQEPHPIFGRSGVALPGLAAKTASNETPETTPSSRPRTVSNVARRYVEKLEDRGRTSPNDGPQVIATQRTGGSPGIRDRTFSTPTAVTPQTTGRPLSQSFAKEGNRPKTPVSSESRSPAPADFQRTTSHFNALRSKSPGRDRYTSSPSPYAHSSASNPPSRAHTPYLSSSRPITPTNSNTVLPQSASTPPQKSSITTPLLARPIQPSPKFGSQGPTVPSSKSPSPAFLRSNASAKELSPSISRLQGRGFVQSMIKAASTQTQQEPSPDKEFGRLTSTAERKQSITNKWTSVVSPPVPSPPLPPPKPSFIPKPKIQDLSSVDFPQATSAEPERPLKRVKSKASLPNLTQTLTGSSSSHVTAQGQLKKKKSVPDGLGRALELDRALGSSSTLISYIKPVKTGDNPITEQPTGVSVKDLGNVDELGMRSSPARGGQLGAAKAGVLSHPTKDRAKKPKKGKGADASAQPRKVHFEEEKKPVAGVVDAIPAPSAKPEKEVVKAAPPASSTTPALTTGAESPQAQSSESSHEAKPSKVASRWKDQAIIGVKPVLSAQPTPALTSQPKPPPNNTIRRALPGMVKTSSLPLAQKTAKSEELKAEPRNADQADTIKVVKSSSRAKEATHSEKVTVHPTQKPQQPPASLPTAAPETEKKQEKQPLTPPSPRTKHVRIPSTGNRATVMDVAQALAQPGLTTSAVDNPAPSIGVAAEKEKPAPAPPSPTPSALLPPFANAEKRKSSSEKYSAFALPPLKEEKSPASSPAGSLRKNPSNEVTRQDNVQPPPPMTQAVVAPAEKPPRALPTPPAPKEEPLPKVNVSALLAHTVPKFQPNPDMRDISLDVMNISGSAAISITRDPGIFYDAEVLAVIHRAKSKSSGLVDTKVWGWLGKQSQLGEKEEKKLNELAKRYNTPLQLVNQTSEPPEFIHVFNGRIIVRQGARAHWSVENTTMHVIRSFNGTIFIDELDLHVKNLCSAFSYCVTLLDQLFVWHGRGSNDAERTAAMEYARKLSENPDNIVELKEDEGEKDEMFWMILGEDDYASADHWRWRRTAESFEPRVWRVDVSSSQKVQLIPNFASEKDPHSSVYIVDCVWELFVLVGKEARSKAFDIRLAVSVTQEMSAAMSTTKPFTPTVHALVLPSQLPLDLRLSVRGLDDTSVNQGETPDHMNLLTYDDLLKRLHHLPKCDYSEIIATNQ